MSMGNPLTLIDYAGNMDCSCNHDMARKAWIEYYAETSDILRILPWENIEGCTKTVEYEGCLPDANIWRLFNEVIAADPGCTNMWTEHLKIAETLMKVDHAMIDCKGRDHWIRHAKSHVKAWGVTWTRDFIHAPASDLRSPIGLEHRLGRNAVNIYDSNSFSQRHFANNFDESTGLAVPGGLPLSINVAQAVLNATDMSLGQAYWIMSPQMKARIQMAQGDCAFCFMPRADLIQNGFSLDRFLGIPILTGYPQASANTPLLPFNEEPEGGNDPVSLTPETTSIYLVVIGMDGVHGIQKRPMEYLTTGRQFDDCHLFESQSWYHMNSWVIENHFAAARISGIRNAPITM